LINVHLSATADTTDDVNLAVTATLHYTADHAVSQEAIERTVVVEFNDQVVASERILLLPDQLEVVQFDNIVMPAQSNPMLNLRLLEQDSLLFFFCHPME
jgi:sulfur carrier protein ThiS